MILLSPVDYSKPNSTSREEQRFVFAAQKRSKPADEK